jgi:hypothetical protein
MRTRQLREKNVDPQRSLGVGVRLITQPRKLFVKKSKEGQGPQTAVEPLMMMAMRRREKGYYEGTSQRYIFYREQLLGCRATYQKDGMSLLPQELGIPVGSEAYKRTRA